MRKKPALSCDTSHCKEKVPRSSTSTSSIQSDEGYNSDERNSNEKDHSKVNDNDEIPFVKSSRIIRISYTPVTYTLTLAIIACSLHILITHPPPWVYTFPPIFVIFQLCLQLTLGLARIFGRLGIERMCVVHGTWLFWTGWLLGVFVFSERLTIDLTHPTTVMFWLLMMERRNAWGIIVWEFVSRLEADPPMARFPQLGSLRFFIFRIWCLWGTGGIWGLLYVVIAKLDGYSLVYLLQFHHILRLLVVSTIAGCIMICFWSFWTFQYRGVIWRRELRRGIVVWYSDGYARAGDVE